MLRIATIDGKNVLDVKQPDGHEPATQNIQAPPESSFDNYAPTPNPEDYVMVGDEDWRYEFFAQERYEIDDDCLESWDPVLSLSKQKIIERYFGYSFMNQKITVFELMSQVRFCRLRTFLLGTPNSAYKLLETTGAMLDPWVPAKFHHWPLFYIKLPSEWKNDIQRFTESPGFSVHLLRNERNPWAITVRAAIISDDRGADWPSEARRIDIDAEQVGRAFRPSVGAVLVCFECMGKLRLTLYPVDDDLATQLQCATQASSRHPLFDATLAEVEQMCLDIERGHAPFDRDSILFDVVQSPKQPSW